MRSNGMDPRTGASRGSTIRLQWLCRDPDGPPGPCAKQLSDGKARDSASSPHAAPLPRDTRGRRSDDRSRERGRKFGPNSRTDEQVHEAAELPPNFLEIEPSLEEESKSPEDASSARTLDG